MMHKKIAKPKQSCKKSVKRKKPLKSTLKEIGTELSLAPKVGPHQSEENSAKRVRDVIDCPICGMEDMRVDNMKRHMDRPDHIFMSNILAEKKVLEETQKQVIEEQAKLIAQL